MSSIVTYKGQLAMGTQEKIHLSTNDGLTGYRIKQFQLMPSAPGVGSAVTFLGKIYITDQTSSITDTVDLSESDLLAVNYYQDRPEPQYPFSSQIIQDKETFNQDIFIYIVDPDGGTVPCNYYIELEKFKIDLNTSTYHTLKNIRSRTQI
jgi:hypothetical protein